MMDHLEPTPSVSMERCKFHQARQEANESIAEYAAKLKKLSIHCNFDNLKTALHDQLVCGIRDKDIRIKLFEDSSLDYEKALQTAITHESAVKNAVASLNTLESRHQRSEVFAIQRGQQQGKWRRGGRGHENGGRQTTERSRGEKQGVVCYCCAQPNHISKESRYRGYTCNQCNKKGHIARACRKKEAEAQQSKGEVKKMTSASEVAVDNAEEGPSHRSEFFSLELSMSMQKTESVDTYKGNSVRERGTSDNSKSDVHNIDKNVNNVDAEPMFVNISINERELNLEIDTGTFVTVISEKIFNDYFKDFKLTKTNQRLRAYDGKTLQPTGKMSNLTVEFNDKTRVLECFMLPGSGPGLMGRQWLTRFNAWPLILPSEKVNEVNKLDTENVKNYFAEKYKELFSDTPGLYNKSKTKLYLRDEARPIALKCRHVALSLKLLIEKEIDRLINLGHLKPVEVSEWATPIVPVFKSNRNIRIYGDFKLTVNPHIIIDKYPLHTIDDIFSKLQGGISFSELDLTHAYMQFPLDESCSDLLTIVTHKGLLRYTKIPEGVSPAPADVQRKMDECLCGIDCVIAYLDNIYVTGRSEEEHKENLEKVCSRLQECGLCANINKCKFMQKRIEVLGFVIDKDGCIKRYQK